MFLIVAIVAALMPIFLYEFSIGTNTSTRTVTTMFIVYHFCMMICFFLLVKAFRFTIHSWKSHQARGKMSAVLKISAAMKSNAERMIGLSNEILSIVQRFSNGVADYDGYALFMCLQKRGYLPKNLKYNVFMFENVVPFLQGTSELPEDLINAFQNIGKEGLTIFHDLGLDPNSDDIYAILIAFAIQKACKGTAQINFVAIAGSDETRKLRAKYLEEIAKDYGMDIANFGNYYFPVQDDIKPLPFIKSDAMEKALDDLDTTSIQSMPSEQIGGIVFFCGHLEKGESSLINLSPDATVIAQTTDNGNFNIPKGDPLLDRCDAIHGKSFTIPWQIVNGIIPAVVKRVNKMAMALMLTSEIPAMTKLSQSGSEQPREGEGHYEVTSAFTRSLVINATCAFYNELYNLL